MARSAASKAVQAAAALDAFLRDHVQAHSAQSSGEQAPRADEDQAVAAPGVSAAVPSAAAPDGGTLAGSAAGTPQQPAHTDWLLHRMVVTGPAAELAAWQQAAAGAGTIPWQLELDSLQEDWFHLLANPAARELSLAGARILAGQLREAVERRHAIALSRVGRSQACPFDLHALVPVPAEVLRLGPDHPHALAWLWQHWGTTQALRHVTVQPPGKDVPPQPAEPESGVIRLSFWSADWTPWRALQRVRTDRPALGFDLRPEYASS